MALTTAPITEADLIVSLLGKEKLVKIEVKGMAALPHCYSEFETRNIYCYTF